MPHRITTFAAPVLLTAAVIATGCAHQQHPDLNYSQTESAVSPAVFMAGHWIHKDNGMVMEEIWFPPHAADGSTAGILRWNAPDGSVRMYELMSLTPIADGPKAGSVAFQLRHFGGEMSPWASEVDGPLRGIVDRPESNRLVIRGTERNGDVASITYERIGDALISTLRFDETTGRDPIVIDFVRAD